MEFNCLKATEPLRGDSWHLTLGPHDFLVLIKLALEGWKAELTFELPSGFEPLILLDRESIALTTRLLLG